MLSESCPIEAPVERGRRWSLWILRLRRPIQIAVFVFFIALPFANAQGWTQIYGSLFALDVYGLPFADPLSAVQVLLTDGHFAPVLWTGAALVVLLVCALGRVFCGWVCPYGLLSELVHAARCRVSSLPVEAALPRHALWCRLALCSCGLAAAYFCAFPVLQRFSMPGELSLAPLRALEDWASYAAALAPAGAVLTAELAGGRRLWCCYVCPQSVCLSLAARCFPGAFGVKWTPGRCNCSRNDRACRRVCTLGLTAGRQGGPPRGECMQCGRCVSACAERGAALRMAFVPST